MVEHKNLVSTAIGKVEHKNLVSTTIGKARHKNHGFFYVVKTDKKHSNMASAITIATESEANKGNIKGSSNGHGNGNNHRNGS
ncbi:unnamed protein product [Prunus brigantina]